ncbi:MAG TPA: ribonuclease H-like domain-containing protein [Candidatus Methylomirabilis sp.]
MKEIYLDVETQRLADEVQGGWDNIRAFGLSVAVTWDAAHDFREWYEDDAVRLIGELPAFERIVTFNGDRFDLEVLSAYGDLDALRQKSLDVLRDLKRRLGFRVSLQAVAQATLGRLKTGSGVDAVTWWRSGDPILRRRVADYCRMDVEILRELVLYGRREGFVKVPSRGKDLTVFVAWGA